MTIEQSITLRHPPTLNTEKSRIDKYYQYQVLIGKIAFIRYHADKEELQGLKKLGIEKHLDEILRSGTLDQVSLQCFMKLRAREIRIQSYPIEYEKIWKLPEVRRLQSLSPCESSKQLETLKEEIRQLDQQLDTRHVRRAIRTIEGRKSVLFSNALTVHEFVPEPGNYQWIKLKVKKLESTADSEEKVRSLKTLLLEIEEFIKPNNLLKEPGYKSLYLRISGLIKPFL